MSNWGVCDEQGMKKGAWTRDEDMLLVEYVSRHGEGRWSDASKFAGLKRNGKSCRLRWVNYLRPGLKKGHLTPQEKGIIIELHALWGNKWSTIARYLPGRTDNEIKNYWRTHFKNTRPSTSSNDHDRRKKVERIDGEVSNQEEMIKIDRPAMIYEDCWGASRRDSIPLDDDDYLWGGFWNMDYDDNIGCQEMLIRSTDFRGGGDTMYQ